MMNILRFFLYVCRAALTKIIQRTNSWIVRLNFHLDTNSRITKEPIPVEDGDVLIENRDELLLQLRSTDIIYFLLERGVIVLDDLNEIKEEERREGRVAGVEKLLAGIHCSGPEGLDKFIESLKYSGYSSLASKLQESSKTIRNRTDLEKSNKSSANRLQVSSKTMRNKTDLEKLNKSSANRLQNSGRTITRTEQKTLIQRLTNRLQVLIQTITRGEHATPNTSSVNRLQESSQTRTRAEQETANKECEDFKNRFEKNYVKSRGKMSSCNEEILRKNHLSIIDNVRVEDIMDHLFSKYVLDWNAMDVINRKLKSGGNREALRYLMEIIYHSGPAVLPSFIDCLYQTGYDDVADCLYNDMDSLKVNDEEG